LNRLFGYFVENTEEVKRKLFLPLHLLRILPIGGVNSAKQWYYYARALHHFLNTLEPKQPYRFYWLDEERKQHKELSDIPQFDEKRRRSLPVVLVIQLHSEPARVDDPTKCDLCGIQPKEYDCRRLRVWV
jgi:hypothetical protein